MTRAETLLSSLSNCEERCLSGIGVYNLTVMNQIGFQRLSIKRNQL